MIMEEIFLADSQGWKEEAEAVIKDVKDHVKLIAIAENLQSTNCCIYLNITTIEDTKLTVELSSQGFCVVSWHGHDHVNAEDKLTYFETPYSLLDTVSPGYRDAFGHTLASQLEKLNQ